MFKLGSRLPIALDLTDPAEMRAVQLSGLRGGAVLRSCMSRSPDSGDFSMEDVGAFVKDLLRGHAFKGKSISILPPADRVVSYPLQVKPNREESFEQALVRKATEVLDMPVADAVLDYVATGGTSSSNGTEGVLLIASRRSDIAVLQEAVKRGGGTLELVEFPGSAVARVHDMVSLESGATTVLCHVGRSRSAVAVVSRNGILAYRSADWGIGVLGRKLTENLALGDERKDADFLLRKHGLMHAVAKGMEDVSHSDSESGTARTVSQLLAPTADELVHELLNLVGYVRSQATDIVFGGIRLYGYGALVAGLDRYVARETNMDVLSVNPLEKVGLQSGRPVPDIVKAAPYGLALGLAMRRVRWL